MFSIRELVCEKDGLLKRSQWIEWCHNVMGSSHCKTCLCLDGCWFRDDRKPKLPLHYGCHCCKKYISQPQPNKTSKAECPLSKFADYVFGPRGEEDGKKSLFENFGFSKDDSAYLKSEFERQAVEKYCAGDYELDYLNEYGQRINIVIELYKNGKIKKFISGWMVRPQGLITNNTPFGGKIK